MRILCAFLATALAATAGEYAVLSNGLRIHADSHESDGGLIRLKTKTGSIEFPASQVARFEVEEYVAPPPPAPAPAPAHASASSAQRLSPKELLDRAAEKAGLPPQIVHSVARAESAYNPNAISPKGAIGLMQLMPQTAAELNANPYDPEQNATAGARYLRDLLAKYENDPHQVSKAIAAYNAGPGAVDKYNGVPPYRETRNYVARVINDYTKKTAKKQRSATTTTD